MSLPKKGCEQQEGGIVVHGGVESYGPAPLGGETLRLCAEGFPILGVGIVKLQKDLPPVVVAIDFPVRKIRESVPPAASSLLGPGPGRCPPGY